MAEPTVAICKFLFSNQLHWFPRFTSINRASTRIIEAVHAVVVRSHALSSIWAYSAIPTLAAAYSSTYVIWQLKSSLFPPIFSSMLTIFFLIKKTLQLIPYFYYYCWLTYHIWYAYCYLFCAASARDFRGIQKNTKHKCTEIYDIISSLLLPKSPPFNLYISVFLFIEIWIDMSFLHRF